MPSLDEDIAAPYEKPSVDVEVEIRGKLREFRFTEMEGPDWAELTARHPVRLESPVDRQYGYNFAGVCKDAAKFSGRLHEGDEWVKVDPKTWDKLWPALSGHDVNVLYNAIWSLNEWEPSQRVERLKKESRLAAGSSQSSD